MAVIKSLFKKIIVATLTFEAKLVLAKYKPKIIAITGSVGKTSTKDAICTVLNRTFFVRGSKKSFNSEFGVPLTILDCPTGWNNPLLWLKNIFRGFSLIVFRHQYPQWLVLEIGADRPGDIEKVSEWLSADIVIITRFGDMPVHVEFFDSIEHLVREKAFLIRSLKKDGLLILNSDDERVFALKEKTKCKVMTYGFESQAMLQADNASVLYEQDAPASAKAMAGKPAGLIFGLEYKKESFPVRLRNSFGRHHIYVALSAIAVGIHLKMKMADVLDSLVDHMPPPGRLRLVDGIKNSIIIDDTYNSSPVAVFAGLQTLGDLRVKGRKIAVLGDMLELGSFAAEAHREVGVIAGEVCNLLFVVGPRARYIVEGALNGGLSEKNIVEFGNAKEAGKHIERMLSDGDAVFVKGSQLMRMERVVEEIMKHPENKKQVLVRQEKEWSGR